MLTPGVDVASPGETRTAVHHTCPLPMPFSTEMWNATVNILRFHPFQVGTQHMSHRLLHRACVCCCRKQMIQLLCKITSTHPRDSPARHQTGFTSVSEYISITVPFSADYLFLPSTPSLNDDNTAVFSLGSRAGSEAAPAWLGSVCQKPSTYRCAPGLPLHRMTKPFSYDRGFSLQLRFFLLS